VTKLRFGLASLATQVMLLFLVATLVPLGVSLARTVSDRRAADDAAWAQARASAALAAEQVDATLDVARGAALTVERLPDFWVGSDERRDEILAALAVAQPAFSALGFFTADLREHGVSSHAAGVARGDLAGRAYAREAVATGRLATTAEPLIARQTGQVVLPVAVPARTTTTVPESGLPAGHGFLVAGLKVDHLPALWGKLPIPPASTVMLIDTRGGHILAGSASVRARVGQVVDAPVLAGIRADNPSFRKIAPDGSERLFAWAPVVGTTWIVAVSIPTAAIYGPIDGQALQRAAEALAAVAATYALLLLLWRRIGSRLDLLQRAAARWARGEWGYRAGVVGRDELGRLAATYDEMADRLAEREAERARAQARQEALVRIAHRLAGDAGGAQILETLVEEATGLVDADAATVFRLDEATGELTPFQTTIRNLGPLPVQPPKLGAAGQAVIARAPIVVDDYFGYPAAIESLRRAGVRAVAAVPLVDDGRVLGALWVATRRVGKRFDVDDVALLELLAGIAAATLVRVERVRFEGVALASRTAAHEMNNRLAIARGFAELLATSPELPASLQKIADTALAGVEAAASVIEQMQEIRRIEETDWGPNADPTIDLSRSTARV
jgi:GAF domain-containing protein/HAMP domain-containing protein